MAHYQKSMLPHLTPSLADARIFAAKDILGSLPAIEAGCQRTCCTDDPIAPQNSICTAGAAARLALLDMAKMARSVDTPQ
jgi:hypothetical protein